MVSSCPAIRGSGTASRSALIIKLSRCSADTAANNSEFLGTIIAAANMTRLNLPGLPQAYEQELMRDE
jgi:hypothetical protein